MQELTTLGYSDTQALADIPDIPSPHERGLKEIATDITARKGHIVQNFIEIGCLLIEAKSQTDKGYGKWLPWLKGIDIQPRTAQVYMELARAYPNTNLISHLGVTKARALLALPAAQRDLFITEPHEIKGKSKKVEEMSVRELKDTIQAEKRTVMKPIRNDNSSNLKNFTKFESDLKVVQKRFKSMMEFLEKYSNDPSLEKFTDYLRSVSDDAQALFSLVAPKPPAD